MIYPCLKCGARFKTAGELQAHFATGCAPGGHAANHAPVLVAASERAKLWVDHGRESGPFVTLALERPNGEAVAIGLTVAQRDRLIEALQAAPVVREDG